MDIDNVKWALTNVDLRRPSGANYPHEAERRWHLSLIMKLSSEMTTGQVSKLVEAVRAQINGIKQRSGLVYITPASINYDGLEGADVVECKRQLRNLRASAMRIALMVGNLQQEVVRLGGLATDVPTADLDEFVTEVAALVDSTPGSDAAALCRENLREMLGAYRG